MRVSGGKKTKRKYLAKLVIDTKSYPTTMRMLLDNMFETSEMSELAYYLMRLAKKGWHEREWLRVLLEFLIEYSSVYNAGFKPDDVEALIYIYNKYEGRATRRNKEVMKKAKELGINLGTWVYRYQSVVRRLKRAGLIYEKDGHFSKSKEFIRIIQKIEDAVNDFYAGFED